MTYSGATLGHQNEDAAILLVFALAVLLSFLLLLHPQLDEMQNSIRPETFLFLILALTVMAIVFIDLGLKKAFSGMKEEFSSSPPSAQSEDRRQDEEIAPPPFSEDRESIQK